MINFLLRLLDQVVQVVQVVHQGIFQPMFLPHREDQVRPEKEIHSGDNFCQGGGTFSPNLSGEIDFHFF